MDKGTFTKHYLDKIRGGLIGGAIGDALGYPIEFMSWKAILKKYGADGIRNYELDFETGAAMFLDDTQMSLFTANGILIGETQWYLKGIQGVFDNDAGETMEEKILRMIRNEGSGSDLACGIMDTPQVSRPA